MDDKKETVLKEFLSVQNLTKLLQIFDSYLQKEGITTDDLPKKFNLKLIFYKAMMEISKNVRDSDGVVPPSVQLNKTALHAVKTVVRNLIVSAESDGDITGAPRLQERGSNSNVLERVADDQVYRDRNQRTEIVSGYESITSKNDLVSLTKQFEDINKIRSGEMKTVAPPAGLAEGFKESPINSSNFESTLSELEKVREEEIVTGDTDKKSEKKNKNKKKKTVEEFSQAITDTQHSALLDTRSVDNSVIRGDISQVQPHDIYKITETLNKAYDEAIFSMPPRDGTQFITPVSGKTLLRKKYLILNSGDRNWTLHKSRYKYSVHFSHARSEIKNVPYYENNPTIPHTKTSKSDGVPNSSGWFDNKGDFRSAYDSTQQKGEIIGYESVKVYTDINAHMQNRLRNVHSMKVTSVIVPLELKDPNMGNSGANTTSSVLGFNFNFNYPYVLLSIDEYNDVFDGTNDTVRKGFCQLVFDSQFSSPNGRGYIKLKPVQDEEKLFYPDIISSLPTLTLSLLKPNGDLLNSTEDAMDIFKIEYEPYQKFYLKIVTVKYFQKDAFYTGDYVRLEDFVLYRITEQQDEKLIGDLNRFINRDSGHEVMAIGDANDSGYYRTFYIRAPGEIDHTSGSFVVNEEVTNQLYYFNNEYDYECNASIKNGMVINDSLQTCVSMTVVTQEYDKTGSEMFQKQEII